MNTYIFIPPVRKPTGGITVFFQIAEILATNGYNCNFVVREKSSWVPDSVTTNVNTIMWNDLKLTSEDLWFVPEGWVNSLTPGLQAGAKCLVYCQNWAYLFSSLPENVSWHDLPVSFLGVSHPVEWFMQQTLGKTSPILRPSIDSNIFYPPADKPTGKINISYMPRKNKALVKQIKDIFNSRNPNADINWIEIANMSSDQVANSLRASHIFLVSGFPEGCPLPPLEALACGAIPVGFSGFGGWDYMRQIDGALFKPWWQLRDVAWSGNGFYSADSDVLDVALNLEKAIDLWKKSDNKLTEALKAGQLTIKSYSCTEQEKSVLEIWKDL